MKTFLLLSNAVVALLFTAFFIYTFLAHKQIDSAARNFAAVKTREYATPMVAAIDQALSSKASQLFASENQRAAVASEIHAFNSDPATYVQGITASTAPETPAARSSPLAQKVLRWKETVRAHYNKVLARLLVDLRIFAGSTVVAAVIAFGCAFKSGADSTPQLQLYSILLLASVALGIYYYIDDLSFFTIIFNWYFGWSYPVLLVALFANLWWEHCRHFPRT